MFITWLKDRLFAPFAWLNGIFFKDEDSDSYIPSSVTLSELKNIPIQLRTADIKYHYLALFDQLMAINQNHYTQSSKTQGPLAYLRLSVQDDGLLVLSSKREVFVTYTTDEAKKIAISIYRLAYAYTFNSNNNDVQLISLGIGHFLMRPFLYIHATKDVLAINNYFRQLTYSFREKIYYKQLIKSINQQEYSAQIIQRAFRKQAFLNRSSSFEPLSPDLKQSMHSHMVPDSPKRPSSLVELTKVQKKRWVETAKPGMEELAAKIAFELVTYRSHNKFMNRLKEVVHQFNAFLHSLPVNDREYAIVVPESYKIKSNHWVTGLAMPDLIKKPLSILYTNEVQAFKEKNNGLKHVVFIDDAVYSGRQLAEIVRKIPINDVKVIVILPFYSYMISRLPNTVKFILGERMYTPAELAIDNNVDSIFWNKKDTEKFNNVLPAYWGKSSDKIGTFFNHRVADGASTFLNNLNLISQNNKNLIPLSLQYHQKYYT